MADDYDWPYEDDQGLSDFNDYIEPEEEDLDHFYDQMPEAEKIEGIEEEVSSDEEEESE